jgi:hypothetical protein
MDLKPCICSVSCALIYWLRLNEELRSFGNHWATHQLLRCPGRAEVLSVSNSLAFLRALVASRQIKLLLNSALGWSLVDTLIANKPILPIWPNWASLLITVLLTNRLAIVGIKVAVWLCSNKSCVLGWYGLSKRLFLRTWINNIILIFLAKTTIWIGDWEC